MSYIDVSVFANQQRQQPVISPHLLAATALADDGSKRARESNPFQSSFENLAAGAAGAAKAVAVAVRPGKMKKEAAQEKKEEWDVDSVNSWLDGVIGELSPKQKKNIMYVEGELIAAGRKHGEKELANQIIKYLAKERMLDQGNVPDFPGMDLPQIEVGDDVEPPEDLRMVAESKRMLVIAGLIKG